MSIVNAAQRIDQLERTLERIKYLHQQQAGRNDDLCTCELFWPCKTAMALEEVQ